MLGMISGSTRCLVAVLCALALAGILVSPAVPSPPTVVGKTMHASVTSLAVAMLPPSCALGAIVLGILAITSDFHPGAADAATGPVFLPLRR